jgi:hypothetical protein
LLCSWWMGKMQMGWKGFWFEMWVFFVLFFERDVEVLRYLGWWVCLIDRWGWCWCWCWREWFGQFSAAEPKEIYNVLVWHLKAGKEWSTEVEVFWWMLFERVLIYLLSSVFAMSTDAFEYVREFDAEGVVRRLPVELLAWWRSNRSVMKRIFFFFFFFF